MTRKQSFQVKYLYLHAYVQEQTFKDLKRDSILPLIQQISAHIWAQILEFNLHFFRKNSGSPCKHWSKLNHSYPQQQPLHYNSLTLALYLWPSSSLFLCPLIFSPLLQHTIYFQSTNQSPAQFTSDSNLVSIAMLISALPGGPIQRQKGG